MTHFMTNLTIAASALALAACGGEDYAESDDTRDEAASTDELAAGYGDPTEPVSTDRGAPQLERAIVSLYEVQTQADVETLIENVYDRADKNDDNALSREEFSLASASLGIADIARDAQSVSESNAVEAQGDADPADEDGIAIGVDSPFFAETAGEDDMLQRSEMRNALMARFEEADEDGDGEFTASESLEFAKLMRSESEA